MRSRASGITVQAKYGPSGTLRDEIAGGAQGGSVRLRQHGASGIAQRNGQAADRSCCSRATVCARWSGPGLGATPENLLDRMRADGVKLATSTPKADPSGDYAFEVFAKAEALIAGSRTLAGNEGIAAHRRAGERAAARGPQRLWLARRAKAAPISSSPTAPTRPRRSARTPRIEIVRAARSARGRRRLWADGDERRARGGVPVRAVHPRRQKDSAFSRHMGLRRRGCGSPDQRQLLSWSSLRRPSCSIGNRVPPWSAFPER